MAIQDGAGLCLSTDDAETDSETYHCHDPLTHVKRVCVEPNSE
jgi:hypothetical protein